jgi:hypothetical protein
VDRLVGCQHNPQVAERSTPVSVQIQVFPDRSQQIKLLAPGFMC